MEGSVCVYAHSGSNLEGLTLPRTRPLSTNVGKRVCPRRADRVHGLCVLYRRIYTPRPDTGGQSRTWLLSPNAHTYAFQTLPFMHVHTRMLRTPHAVR